jgi:NosR/NirI family nitrous oxide reductase transcriptional regulator
MKSSGAYCSDIIPPVRQSLAALFALAAVAVLTAQGPADAKLQANLKHLFPAATSFSPKGGDPPHFKAMNGQTLLGLAFWTTELQPLERAYDGPIKILVGMDTKGILTGIIVVVVTGTRGSSRRSRWRSE